MPDLRYHIVSQGELHTLELILPRVLDAVEFDRLNESLAKMHEHGLSQRWIVDLAGVDYIGSAMLGLLVNLRQRIKSAGGRLVLCGMSETLLKAMRTCSLHSLFTISATRIEAEKTVKSMR